MTNPELAELLTILRSNGVTRFANGDLKVELSSDAFHRTQAEGPQTPAAMEDDPRSYEEILFASSPYPEPDEEKAVV